MGNITLKQQDNRSTKKNNKPEPKKVVSGDKFVLSDVPKEELERRRIPVYSYLL